MNNTRYPLDMNDDDDDDGGVDNDGDDDNNNNNNNFGGRALHTLRYQPLCFVWIYSYLLNETLSAAAVKLN